jgi:hypothetical protein
VQVGLISIHTDAVEAMRANAIDIGAVGTRHEVFAAAHGDLLHRRAARRVRRSWFLAQAQTRRI